MIISIVCDFLGAENNGTTIATYNLIQGLSARGHLVNIICPDRDKSGIDSYYVVPQKKHLTRIEKKFANQILTFAKPKASVIRNAVACTDVIFIMTPFTLGKYMVKYARKHSIPLVAGFHCQADSFIGPSHIGSKSNYKKRIYKKMYNDVYRHCQAIHFPSAFICGEFENCVGFTPHYVISSGISPEFNCNIPHVKPTDNSIRILYTARLARSKNHKVLIDAVNRSKYKNRIQLIFAGTGNYQNTIEKDACELINQPIIKHFSKSELLTAIGSCDLYVHSAQDEIEGIACLEAVACGLVPIINNSPTSAATKYAIDDKNLFNHNDASDLAAKIDYWLDNPAKRQERCDEYINFTDKWNLDKCMDDMENMLKHVVYRG